MPEKCSLIVLNYNGKRFLDECLTSLKYQSYRDYKVYVVDNASTDGSVEYLRESFPWVTVIEAADNLGTAEGSNLGVRNTPGEYVVLMSNDIKVDKDCLENLLKAIESDSRVGICTAKLVKYAPNKNTGRYLIDNAGGIIDKFAFPIMLRSNEINDESQRTVEEVFFSCGGGFIIIRELFERAGGFDRRYFTLGDDIDLSWRLRMMGYKIVVNHSAIIFHKVSATLGVIFAKSQRRYWSERNSFRSILKNYELATLIKILPQYLSLLSLEAAFYLVTGRYALFFAIGKTLIWNIVNLPDTLRERSRMQSLRMVKDKLILGKMYKGSIKLKSILDNLKLRK